MRVSNLIYLDDIKIVLDNENNFYEEFTFCNLLYNLNKVALSFISPILHDFALTRGLTRVHHQLLFYFGNVGSVVG